MKVTYETYTREEFWEKCPPPGTLYMDIDEASVTEVVAEKIDVKEQDPDDILMTRYPIVPEYVEGISNRIIVIKWGEWRGRAGKEVLESHDKSARLMEKVDGVVHECGIGRHNAVLVKKV